MPKITIPSEDDPEDELEIDLENEYYNRFGDCSPGGLFDAGGHPIAERWFDYVDTIRDRLKDRG